MLSQDPGARYGWIPMSAVVSVPCVAEALATVPAPQQARWVAGSIKAGRSDIVRVNHDGLSVMRQPLHERIAKSVNKLFMPGNLAQDLWMHAHTQADGSILASVLLEHPDLTYLQRDTPAQRATCQRALDKAQDKLYNLTVTQDDSGSVVDVRAKPLIALVLGRVEFLFSDINRHDAAMSQLWAKACKDHAGWVPVNDVLKHQHIQDVVRSDAKTLATLLRTSETLVVGFDQSEQQFVVSTQAHQHTLDLSSSAAEASTASSDTESDTSLSEAAASPAPPTACTPPPPSIAAPVADGTTWLPGQAPAHDFSVMSYNVLADFLTKTKDDNPFDYVNPADLRWGTRCSRIIERVTRVMPSILCLQEVQIADAAHASKHHVVAISRALNKLGYTGQILRKTQHKPRPCDIGNAVYWDSSFTLESSRDVSFSRALHERCQNFGPETTEYFSHGHQVALMLALRHTASEQLVVVCVTHISASWTMPAKQLAQVQECLLQLEAFVAELTTDTCRPHVVLAGDFNSKPTSAAYTLATEGHVPSTHPHCAIADQDGNAAADVVFPFASLDHGLGLRSAYATVLGAEPECTNVTEAFEGTLDYVFHSSDLHATQVLPVPGVAECRVHRGLPDAAHPSDHLPIAACFAFAKM